MAASNRLTLNFKDIAGRAATIVMRVAVALTDPNNATVQAIRNAVVAILDAINTRASISIPATVADTATSGPYTSADDEVVWTFLDSNDQTHNIKTKAPNPAIFQADNETVNLANALAAAWVTAVTTHGRTVAGATFTACLQARRSFVK